MNPEIKSKEERHLNNVISKINEARSSLSDSMEKMGAENLSRLQELRENPETGMDFFLFLEQLHEKNLAFNFKDKYKMLEEFEYLLKEPYFARIDLVNTENLEKNEIYIGKFGFSDEKPVVTDWRSKVASVYYRYRYPQKNIKYDTPEGPETRDLKLKRTYEIDNGELVKYYNNDIQLDESQIIVEKIGKRTGGVLEDIVETIQESQLDIIEADPRQVCIVQGCVGSGKSTVAIHKLSHIFFNYPNYINAERSILIAKNQILVGYLSTLFPKLGIFDINYKTLKDLVYQSIFREELGIDVDLNVNEDTSDFDIKEISKVFNKMGDIHSDIESQINDIYDSDEEFETFRSYKYNKSQTPFKNILDIINDLEEELEMQKFSLKENPNSIKAWLYKENVKNIRKLLTKLRKLRDKVRTGLLKDLCNEFGIVLNTNLNYLETLIYLFLYTEIVGFTKVLEYEYCVIDEGQDFSPLEYIIISKFVLRGRIAIFGDLNQAIESDGLYDWTEVTKVIKEAKRAARFELDTNYRSTKQIIDFANNILSPYTNDYLPKSINRAGREPVVRVFNTKDEMLDHLRVSVKTGTEVIDKSIGIICFNPDTYYKAEQLLDDMHIPKDKLIKLDSSQRINYIPKGIYLSKFEDCKGLEFSKVYVLDLNLDDIRDYRYAKKAFVAVTRAMNELEVLC